jgi:2-hydroxychromene-2-carboxylate isomerase
MSRLTFFFDYSSPFAYLGATQVEAVAEGHELVWQPFLLGGLFKAIGTANVPLAEMPEVKQAYQLKDMHRWAEHIGVPFNFPTRFPMMTVTALRMTLQLNGAERTTLAHAIFKAYWADDRHINDKPELVKIADEADLNGQQLLEGCSDPDIKALLRANTEGAAEVGLCGAPSFLVQDGDEDGVLFWGQDRLPLVKKALDGWRPEHG